MRRAVQTTWQSTREVIEGANYEEADWKDQVGLATLSRAHPKHWGGGGFGHLQQRNFFKPLRGVFGWDVLGTQYCDSGSLDPNSI